MYFWNNAFEVETPSFYFTFKAHTPRVKKVKHLKVTEQDYLVTCSTDGTISIWEISEILQNMKNLKESKALDEEIKPFYSLPSYQRIITMDVHFASQVFKNDPVVQDQPEEEEGEELELEDDEVKPKNKKGQQQAKQQKGPTKAEKQGKKIKKVQFADQKADKNPKKQQTLQKQKFQQKKLNNVQNQPRNVPRKNKAQRG